MNVKPFSIPRAVYLPGVRIKVVRRKLKGDYGTWNYATSTITIDSQQPIAVQRYILQHELLHAINDYQHMCFLDKIFKLPKGEHGLEKR